jgi:hypothetical protein
MTFCLEYYIETVAIWFAAVAVDLFVILVLVDPLMTDMSRLAILIVDAYCLLGLPLVFLHMISMINAID